MSCLLDLCVRVPKQIPQERFEDVILVNVFSPFLLLIGIVIQLLESLIIYLYNKVQLV